MSIAPFQLSTSLKGHEADVKAVSSPTDDIIISASRDKSVRLWFRSSANSFEEAKIYLGHSNFVNSIAYIKPSEKYPQGLIVSGSSDKTINVYDIENAFDPIYSLIGHSDNICALDITPSGHIVSGSWDKTAKIWINWTDSYTLKGHSHAVWAVLAWNDELILTGSADKSIIKWQNGKRIHTYTGHTDCVRDLALLQGIGFVSCANDSTLRIWTIDGHCIRELNGHESFVYSVDVLPTGEIVSSGEDRSIRVWKDETCIQTIMLPAMSIWNVASMPNGDIISGSSDGIIYVFTRASERLASRDAIKDFEEKVSKQAISKDQIGDLNRESLPGTEALLKPGKKEGQVLMIRKDSLVEAYQWSETDKSWKKIGEVVDAVGQGRRQLYNGKEYDYVFDVDIGDGVPPLKLPYNATDNPYQAAQEFIWANELPQGYLDQIAEFITKNSQGVSIGATSQYSDPFTGGSRYTPNAAATTSTSSSNIAPNFLDPWTSSGASSSSSTSETKKTIPQKTYLTYSQANLQAMLKKINQLNNELNSDISLSPEELASLEKLSKFLQDPNPQLASSPERENEFLVIKKMLTFWPSHCLFPGIDLLRLFSLHTSIPAQYSDEKGNIIKLIGSAIGISSLVKDEQLPKEKETNLMLYLKVLVNLFNSKEGKNLLRQEAATIFESISSIWKKSTNTNLQIAFITTYLNFSILYSTNPDEDLVIQMMATIVELLESVKDSEVIYRALVTLGTLIFHHTTAKDAADAFDVKNVLKNISGKESRITSVHGEILQLI